MKSGTFFFLVGLQLCFGISNAQISIQPGNKIVIGKIDNLHSKILNEDRKIYVYVPAISAYNPRHNYPVVYLLDGDEHFCSVMAMIQHLSEIQRNTILPQMILVGIQNKDRGRDFGGELFTSFIENELIPYVDSIYPTSQYRILIGHSLGGLFTINTFLNHTHLFKSYLAIDPTINHDLLNQADKILKIKDFTEDYLYLAIANSPAVFFEDTSMNNRYRAMLKLTSYFEANKKNNLNFSWKFYKDDDHQSVPFIAEYDGLRYFFNYYKFPEIDKLINSSNPDSIITLNYQNTSKILGYKVMPNEGDLSGLGYIFLQKKLYAKSYSVFKMLIDNYPPNFMVFDAMGELLKAKGDTAKAIEYFEKSLSLNPQDAMARDNIEKMKDFLKGKK